MQCLVPLLFYTGISSMTSGVERALFSADFTDMYIGDHSDLGPDKVGYVSAVYGATNAVSSLAVGLLFDQITTQRSEAIVTAAAGVMHLVCFIVLLADTSLATGGVWSIAALYGLADGITLILPNILLGRLFTDDLSSAFGNLRLWYRTTS